MALKHIKEGTMAYWNDVPLSMCPYGVLSTHDESSEASDWRLGWHEANQQDINLFSNRIAQ